MSVHWAKLNIETFIIPSYRYGLQTLCIVWALIESWCSAQSVKHSKPDCFIFSYETFVSFCKQMSAWNCPTWQEMILELTGLGIKMSEQLTVGMVIETIPLLLNTGDQFWTLVLKKWISGYWVLKRSQYTRPNMKEQSSGFRCVVNAVTKQQPCND